MQNYGGIRENLSFLHIFKRNKGLIYLYKNEKKIGGISVNGNVLYLQFSQCLLYVIPT